MSLYNIIDASINKNHYGDKRLCVRVARISLPLNSLPNKDQSENSIVMVDDIVEERKPIIGIYIPSSKHLELILSEIQRATSWKSSISKSERSQMLMKVNEFLVKENPEVPEPTRLKVNEYGRILYIVYAL